MKGLRRKLRWGGVLGLATIAAVTLPWSAPASHSEANAVFLFRDTALAGSAGGGEPSIALDNTFGSPHKGAIYATTLSGPGIWHSYNGGLTWSGKVIYDNNLADPQCEALAGGGDEDVIVLPNGNVVVADLAVVDNAVQVSTNGAQTFGPCAGTAPESDRPWFGYNPTPLPNGSCPPTATPPCYLVYLGYHDFVAEAMVVCSSLDGGSTWGPCNQASTNNQIGQCAENTVPARPTMVDPTDGSIHLLYSCSTALENAQHPPYGPLHDYYVANSFGPYVDGQPAGYLAANVFIADTGTPLAPKNPNYGGIFSTLRSDSAGNYYAVFVGTADDNHVLSNPFHAYFTVSTDKGVTWRTPVQIDNDPPSVDDPTGGKGTHVFVDMIATTPGHVDIAWLGAPATGEPNGICGSTGMTHDCMDGTTNVGMQPGGPVPGNWKVYMVQSTNALSATPTFSITEVTPTVMHTGEICTNGIVCGDSDRSLGDYISIDVDCAGLAHIGYARNANPSGLTIHEVDQTGGPALNPPPVCNSPTAVKLSSFTAARERSGVVLRWRTATELGDVGFNVLRAVNGVRVQLNKRLIYSSASGTARGHTYTWHDSAPSRHARYWLQEVRSNGQRVMHGPIAPSAR
jgi:hypothetical protein